MEHFKSRAATSIALVLSAALAGRVVAQAGPSTAAVPLATAAADDRTAQSARGEFTTQYLIITVVGGGALLVGTVVAIILCCCRAKNKPANESMANGNPRRGTNDSESSDSARTVPTAVSDGRHSRSRSAWAEADELPEEKHDGGVEKSGHQPQSEEDDPTTDAGDCAATSGGGQVLVETASACHSPTGTARRPSAVLGSLNGSRASTHAHDLTCDDVDETL